MTVAKAFMGLVAAHLWNTVIVHQIHNGKKWDMIQRKSVGKYVYSVQLPTVEAKMCHIGQLKGIVIVVDTSFSHYIALSLSLSIIPYRQNNKLSDG